MNPRTERLIQQQMLENMCSRSALQRDRTGRENLDHFRAATDGDFDLTGSAEAGEAGSASFNGRAMAEAVAASPRAKRGDVSAMREGANRRR